MIFFDTKPKRKNSWANGFGVKDKPCRKHIQFVVGIDPGVEGALAVFKVTDDLPFKFVTLPFNGNALDSKAFFDILREYDANVTLVVCENVIVKRGMKAQNMGTVGKNFGSLKTAVELFGAEFLALHPQTWQANFGLGRFKAPEGKGSKEKARMLFTMMFPTLVVNMTGPKGGWNHNIVDAILIAYSSVRNLRMGAL